MTTEERLKHSQLTVKPLIDAYFTWTTKQNLWSVTPKSKTAKGLTHSLNQEKYLKTFKFFIFYVILKEILFH